MPLNVMSPPLQQSPFLRGFGNPQTDNLSGGGWGAQIGDINSLLQAAQRGAFRTQPLDLQRLMQLYNQFLGGAEQRQASQMGQQGFAQGASMGLQNPGLLANRFSNQAYQNFADQYGRAGMELPQVAFQSQLSANNQNIDHILRLLALRMGALGGQFQQEQSNFNFGRDVVPGLIAAGGKIGTAAVASDRRLKKNIHQLSNTPIGIPIYEFEYVWGGGRKIGAMADEVEQIIPQAVINHSSGYKMVDYSMLK